MIKDKIKKLKKELRELKAQASKLKQRLEEEDRNPYANSDFKFLQQKISKVKMELLSIETRCREAQAKKLEDGSGGMFAS